MMKKKAIIISIKSYTLSSNEKLLFKKNPWGVILFKRNIKNLSQIKSLISSIKKITKNPYFPILIDEEGDKVSRLKKIINLKSEIKELDAEPVKSKLLQRNTKDVVAKRGIGLAAHTSSGRPV